MAYIGAFNSATVEPSDRSALPAGVYPAIITDSEMKSAKSGGQYLSLTFQVVDGPHKGRFLWHSLNLFHANAKAVDIAQRELSAICRATGVHQIASDSAELHNHPHLITVAYIPAGEFPEKNQVKKWEPMRPVAVTPRPAAAPVAPRPAAPSAPAPVAAAPAPAARTTPPWKQQPAAPVAQPAEEVAEEVMADVPF